MQSLHSLIKVSNEIWYFMVAQRMVYLLLSSIWDDLQKQNEAFIIEQNKITPWSSSLQSVYRVLELTVTILNKIYRRHLYKVMQRHMRSRGSIICQYLSPGGGEVLLERARQRQRQAQRVPARSCHRRTGVGAGGGSRLSVIRAFSATTSD